MVRDIFYASLAISFNLVMSKKNSRGKIWQSLTNLNMCLPYDLAIILYSTNAGEVKIYVHSKT